jgi:hypothetical protein
VYTGGVLRTTTTTTRSTVGSISRIWPVCRDATNNTLKLRFKFDMLAVRSPLWSEKLTLRDIPRLLSGSGQEISAFLLGICFSLC